MKTIFYSKDASFNLSDDEFANFIEKSKSGEKVWIPRLQVFLSGMFIWAGEKPDDPNRRKLRDGSYAVKRSGQWVCEHDNSIKLDMSYYPELLESRTDLIK